MTLRAQASRGLAVVLLLWIVSAVPAHGQIAGYRISFTPAVPTIHDPITVALTCPGGCGCPHPEGSIQSAQNGATVTVTHVFTDIAVVIGDSNCEDTTIIDLCRS